MIKDEKLNELMKGKVVKEMLIPDDDAQARITFEDGAVMNFYGGSAAGKPVLDINIRPLKYYAPLLHPVVEDSCDTD